MADKCSHCGEDEPCTAEIWAELAAKDLEDDD